MKKYTVKAIKSGREWKSFVHGLEHLDDNKFYRLEWELTGIRNLIRGYWGIAFKKPHYFYMQGGARLKR